MNDDLLNGVRVPISNWFSQQATRAYEEGITLANDLSVRTAQQNAILQTRDMVQEQINSARPTIRHTAYFRREALPDEQLIAISNNSAGPSISSHFVGLRKGSSVPVADVEKSVGLSADLWDSIPAQELVDAIVALARGY